MDLTNVLELAAEDDLSELYADRQLPMSALLKSNHHQTSCPPNSICRLNH